MDKTHSPYDLLPDAPSSTRWLLDLADAIPQKLHRALPRQYLTGQPDSGEIHQITNVQWRGPPEAGHASRNDMITRPLEITLAHLINTRDRPQKATLKLPVPGVPYPNTKGAYTYGANEYYAVSHLTQKPGIFFVNSEERPNSPGTRDILWKTPDVLILQGKNNLFIQTLQRNGLAASQPLVLPRPLWGAFARTLENYRNKTGSRIDFRDLPNEPELIKKIQQCLDHNTGENIKFKINQWLKQVANAQNKTPESHRPGWREHFDTLASEYPDLAPELKILQATPHWNIHAARAAEILRERLPEKEFLPPNHMGRLHVETGAERLTRWLALQINQVFDEAASHYQQNNASHTLEIPWFRHDWEAEMKKFFISPAMPKVINEAPTPSATAIKAGLIKNKFDLFRLNAKSTLIDAISDLNRTHHPSAIGFIAAMSPESGNVGVDHWLCAAAKIDPLSNEILKPVAIKNGDGNTSIEFHNWEQFNRLERELGKQHSGVHIGFPDTSRASVLLRIEGRVTASCPPGEITAYLPCHATDMLPLHLAKSGNTPPARQPMAHAGENNARLCNGAEPPARLTGPAKNKLKALSNIGVCLAAPASGTLTALRETGEFILAVITEDNGDNHICQIPRQKINAFKNPMHPSPWVKPGDKVAKGDWIAGPEQAPYRKQAREKNFTGFHSGVNCNALLLPTGIEDTIMVSAHSVASGRYDQPAMETLVLKQKKNPVHLKKIQPGTLVHPGEILAWQIEHEKIIPLVTGPAQGGILEKVSFISDPDNPAQIPVQLEAGGEPAPEKTLLAHIRSEIKNAADRFARLRDSLDPDYITRLREQGIDPLACIEKFTGRQPDGSLVSLSLRELQSANGCETLASLLAGPRHGLTIDKHESYLNENLHYALKRIEHVRELLSHPVSRPIPKHAGEIVFEIKTEKLFQTGSKLNDPQGTKGITVIDPHMPFIRTENGPRPADVSFTVHAVLARGSLEKLNGGTAGKQTVLLYSPISGLTKIHTEVIPAYYHVQKSSTLDNKHVGKPVEKGRDYMGMQRDGNNMSVESQIHAAASLQPMFLQTAEKDFSRDPGIPQQEAGEMDAI
ncbi:hypothetical protein OH491_24085 [Termitidicoccus mucosus]|uniref:Uncharacterized protein n=1 Tax=Termitidicoccus mucosus TaxID=1184151 RepID=A0A178IQH5_9BACT|nr:hypothetical protein AW736_02370 [Opitutaceae bacterium TSB47]